MSDSIHMIQDMARPFFSFLPNRSHLLWLAWLRAVETLRPACARHTTFLWLRGKARGQLQALAASKLATGRAWILKETFQHFWSYRSVTWAGGFLKVWTERALRSRLEPMRKVARTLRSHECLLMNWFKAKGELSSGAVEGLNNKIRVVTRRSYGFRTYKAMEIALYHNLGRLPEPKASTHNYC